MKRIAFHIVHTRLRIHRGIAATATPDRREPGPPHACHAGGLPRRRPAGLVAARGRGRRPDRCGPRRGVERLPPPDGIDEAGSAGDGGVMNTKLTAALDLLEATGERCAVIFGGRGEKGQALPATVWCGKYVENDDDPHKAARIVIGRHEAGKVGQR